MNAKSSLNLFVIPFNETLLLGFMSLFIFNLSRIIFGGWSLASAVLAKIFCYNSIFKGVIQSSLKTDK